jgi:hypothetical protein
MGGGDVAEVNTFRCDECGIQKQTTNHWWAAHAKESPVEFFISPWDEAVLGNAHHYCGQSCVHAAMDRWMTTGSLEKK